MKRSAVLLALTLMFGAAIAQGQIVAPPSQTAAPKTSSESSADRVVVTNPRVTYSPDPKYPKKARKAHKEGVVVLSVVVGGDGLTRDIKVERGLSPELDDAAIDAVKKWKFAPALKEGKPVAVRINIEINFRR